MSDLSIVEVTRPDAIAALELWFFRDLTDDQRGKLFDLLYGAERGAEIQGMYVQRMFLRSAFARHRASEAERVREACAKVRALSPVSRLTKGYACQKEHGTHMVDLIDSANCNVIASAVYEPYADEILAAIRSLPIGGV